jgi:uncharacterized membrane protein SpoIIM required for sporulation
MSKPTQQPGIAARAAEWERLRAMLLRVGKASVSQLSEDELWELPGLYRKTISDLSLLRTSGASPALREELESICNKAHALIYSSQLQRRGGGLYHYLARELPRAVRRRWGHSIAAAAIMLFFSVIGYLHAQMNPAFTTSVLGPRMTEAIRSNLEGAREAADLGLAAQIEPEQRSGMALAITLNNVGVSIRAFLFGIGCGFLTIVILAFNGYMLGAIMQIYLHAIPGISVNLPLYFWAGIAPHGCIELSAISLSAAAGMLLGFSWMYPGRLGRGDAMRSVAPDAMRIVLTVVLTLVVAGSIEGFITPLECPQGLDPESWYWAKIAFGVLVWLVWLLWLSLGGRDKSRLVNRVSTKRASAMTAANRVSP